jgi:type 1 glutamine amidotransferase
MAEKIKVALITGNHPFEVPQFHDVFRWMEGIDLYPQNLQEFGFSGFKKEKGTRWEDIRKCYDVYLFYNFHKNVPPEEVSQENWFERGSKRSLQALLGYGKGFVFLHHALIAFLQWRLWSDLIGIADRHFTFSFDESIRFQIADPEHPITRGLENWEMIDETYNMDTPGDDSHVLITADHPLSMRAVAWTREVAGSRVFCYQSGHDSKTYGDPRFREVLRRDLYWAAGKI